MKITTPKHTEVTMSKKDTPIRKLFDILWECDKDKFVWCYHLNKMELEFKKQIKEAYERGEFDCGSNGTSEDYYNKTYPSKNKLGD